MNTRSRKLRKDLAASTGDGATYSFMVGVSEMYFIPFVLALGVGEVSAGLFFTIPYLCGSVLQLLAPWGVSFLKSPRKWVLCCAVAQCLSFIPLIDGAIRGSLPAWVIFASFALYWGAAIGAGPAWAAWVAALIPSNIRPKYFGRRSRICQLMTLTGLSVAGAFLFFGEHFDGAKHIDQATKVVGEFSWQLVAFASIFFLGLLSRGASIPYLVRQSEPPSGAWKHSPVPLRTLLIRPLMGQERPLLLFMLVFQLALQISSPFVASYLIGEIGFSNATYFAAAATLFATKSIAVSIFGSIASRRGPRFVLVLSAGFLTAHAALFALPPETSTIFILMALSGICWAGYEIATFLLLLDVSKPEERTSILTSFNLLNALALVAGSLVGGSLLHWLGDDRKAYALLFLISAGARLAALSLLRFVLDTRGSKSDQKEAHPSNLQEISMEEDGSFNRPPESIL